MKYRYLVTGFHKYTKTEDYFHYNDYQQIKDDFFYGDLQNYSSIFIDDYGINDERRDFPKTTYLYKKPI